MKRLQSRRQFCACTPVVRFGNFIGEPYEIGATEHIARISIKWCYRAHCIATLCEALAVWWSFLTISAFAIERLDNSPHQGTSAPLHFVYAKFHLLDAIAIPFSLCKHGSSLSGGAQPSRASFCSSSRYRLHAHGRRKTPLMACAIVSPLHSCYSSDPSQYTARVSPPLLPPSHCSMYITTRVWPASAQMAQALSKEEFLTPPRLMECIHWRTLVEEGILPTVPRWRGILRDLRFWERLVTQTLCRFARKADSHPD